VYDPKTTVTCTLVFQEHWQTEMAGLLGGS